MRVCVRVCLREQRETLNVYEERSRKSLSVCAQVWRDDVCAIGSFKIIKKKVEKMLEELNDIYKKHVNKAKK